MPPNIIIKMSMINERLKPLRVTSKLNPINMNKQPKRIINKPVKRKIKRNNRFLGCIDFKFSISSSVKFVIEITQLYIN